MIYLNCQIHSLPRYIIYQEGDLVEAVCLQCFNSKANIQKQITGVMLKYSTLTFFICFSEYLQQALNEWCWMIHQNGLEEVFQKNILTKTEPSIIENHSVLIETAIEVINAYRQLIQSNRQCVNSNLNIQVMYHPSFLKDIYSMVMYNWQYTAQIIQTNFINCINERMINPSLSHYTIKQHLIEQINQEKDKLLSPYAQEILITATKQEQKQKQMPNLFKIPTEFSETFDNHQTICITEDEEELGIFGSPLIIKKIDSVIEVKQHPQSAKSIEQQPPSRKNKMKKSKLIDEDDFNQWKTQFLSNLHQLQRIKKQNQLLKEENAALSLQKQHLTRNYTSLQKQLELERQHHSPSRISNTVDKTIESVPKLTQHILSLEEHIKEKQQDIGVLIDCVNHLIESYHLSPEAIDKKMKSLKTVQFN